MLWSNSGNSRSPGGYDTLLNRVKLIKDTGISETDIQYASSNLTKQGFSKWCDVYEIIAKDASLKDKISGSLRYLILKEIRSEEGKTPEEIVKVVKAEVIYVARQIIADAGVTDELLVRWGVNSDKDIIKFSEFIKDGLKPNSDMFFYEWFNRSSFKFSELDNLGIHTYKDLNKAFFDFERMNNDFLEHVFWGELNNSNKLTGYHYENYPNAIAKVKSIIKSPNRFGVYEAEVETITGGIIKEDISTFFPKDWTPKQVVDAVMEAYWNRTSLPNGWWEGTTKNGMIIQMGIENSGFAGMPRIVTAFPVYQ